MFEAIKGKKVLITGATGGMGEAMAKLFALNGAHLGLHYLSNREKAEELKREVERGGRKAEVLGMDLLKKDEREKLIPTFLQKLGGLDVLINNAGAVYDHAYFSELEEEVFEKTFALNVEAPFYLSGEAFEYMKGYGGGRIINISSVNVKYGGSARSLHYCAAKAALESLTIGFAREGAQYNILVNAIRCGYIDTPMRTRIKGYKEEDAEKRVNLIPLRRMGKPIDVARMALFLASEAGDFITKEIFTVAGGD